MTNPQRTHLFAELWPNACHAQNWPPNDDQKRYAIFAQVFGQIPRHAATLAAGQHISAKDINTTADFDRLKAHLLCLADNLPGAIETDHPELGDRRRYLWLIRNDVHRQFQALGIPYNPYLIAILRAQHKTEDLDLLDTPELQRLLMTLTARLDAHRRTRRWTKHQLRHQAALPCPPGCRECHPSHQSHQSHPSQESLPQNPF